MKIKIYTVVALMATAPLVKSDVFFSNSVDINAANTVDYFSFTLDTDQQLDIFTNGPTTDPQFYLFQGNVDTLNLQSLVAGDDDSCPNGRCGPSGTFFNALLDDITLAAGDYTLAISDYGDPSGGGFTSQEAIDGENDIVQTGNIEVNVASPDTIDEPGSELLAVSRINLERQRSQQIIRQTNSLVSQRLAREISGSFRFFGELEEENEEEEEEAKIGASSDNPGASYSPDVFWSNVSYSNLSEDGTTQNYVTDLYQFVGGIDKQINNFYIGSALTYVHGDTRQTGNDNTSHSVGITPYFAYKITDAVFASALLGYNYSHVNGTTGNADADVHDYSAEINLNAFHQIDSFIIKGRAGLRYKHNFTSLQNSLDADFDELVWMGDIELGYNINKSLSVYAGSLYEYRDQEAYNTSSIKAVNSGVIHDGIFFVRAGVNYNIASNLMVGLNATTEVSDEDNDLYTVGLDIRLDI